MNHELRGRSCRRRGWSSPVFWLGGFGLSFLGWAWVDSNQQASKLKLPHQEITLVSTHGHLLVIDFSPAAEAGFAVDEWLGIVYPVPGTSVVSSCYGPMPMAVGGVWEWEFYRTLVHAVQRTWFPPFRFQRSEDPATPFTLLAIPYWGSVVLYLALWLVWWRYRKARLMGGRDRVVPGRLPPQPLRGR
jgi:hypothetical protein